MSSFNKVILIGRLGRDPEVKYMPNGDAVANIALATSETWKDKQSGEKKEATEWHRVTMFRRLAEIAGEYISKGSLISVEGKLQTRKWQDKDGIERYTTEIVASDMRMLGSKNGGSHSDDEEEEGSYAPSPAARPAARPAVRPAPNFSDMDDDIPF